MAFVCGLCKHSDCLKCRRFVVLQSPKSHDSAFFQQCNAGNQRTGMLNLAFYNAGDSFKPWCCCTGVQHCRCIQLNKKCVAKRDPGNMPLVLRVSSLSSLSFSVQVRCLEQGVGNDCAEDGDAGVQARGGRCEHNAIQTLLRVGKAFGGFGA